jgi:hypothetical protein
VNTRRLRHSNGVTPISTSDTLDAPLYGVTPIGRAALIVDDKGEVDVRRTYYALEKGLIPARKFGKKWVSTLRQIRNAFLVEAPK